MARRPLAFGVRIRKQGRTLSIRGSEPEGRYVSEVRRPGGRPQRQEHASLGGAVKRFASAWRQTLH